MVHPVNTTDVAWSVERRSSGVVDVNLRRVLEASCWLGEDAVFVHGKKSAKRHAIMADSVEDSSTVVHHGIIVHKDGRLSNISEARITRTNGLEVQNEELNQDATPAASKLFSRTQMKNSNIPSGKYI